MQNSHQHKESKILVICGTTATGKTSLALEISRQLGQKVTIISTDSRQAYKGLPIVTGQDIPSNFTLYQQNLPSSPQLGFMLERELPLYKHKNITIFGNSIINPNIQINISQFTKLIWFFIKQQLSLGEKIILVGGSGLYLQAITQANSTIHIPPNQKLRDTLSKKSLTKLQEILKSKDQIKFNNLNHSDLHNPRRLIRAIELASHKRTKPKLSHRDLQRNSSFMWLRPKLKLEDLKQNIHSRVKQRIKDGAIKEVEGLIQKYPKTSLPIYTTLGVSQILKYLSSGNLDILISSWTQAEVSYAKRQVVWFKKRKQIICYDISNKQKLISNALLWLNPQQN